jgi:hypothetical protein
MAYGCPSEYTKSRKEVVTDAFGIPFHTDIIDNTRGVNAISASEYRIFFASYYRTGTCTHSSQRLELSSSRTTRGLQDYNFAREGFDRMRPAHATHFATAAQNARSPSSDACE